MEDNISIDIRKIEDMFILAENSAKKLDNDDPGYINLDNNLLQNSINAIWHTIYTINRFAIGIFVGSFETHYKEGRIGQDDYNQIKPLLSKWGQISELKNFIDQQQFSDFQTDLRAFSEQYPKWFDSGEPLIEHFQKNLWKPCFEKYSSLAEDISKRYEIFLEKKRDKSYVLVKTNYAFISPYEFEELVADLFKRMGYDDVILTPKTRDYGVDVIAKGKGDVIAIQAKKYTKGNNVSNRDVQIILGAMQLSTIKANKAILITTSDFTVQAVEQAEEAPIELWNGEYLNSIVIKYFGIKHKA
jgi:Restriction endonuclease